MLDSPNTTIEKGEVDSVFMRTRFYYGRTLSTKYREFMQRKRNPKKDGLLFDSDTFCETSY